MSRLIRWSACAALTGATLLASCSSSADGGSSGTLTINSSTVLVSGLRANLSIPVGGGGGTGINASALTVGMYALYASTNADCSSPVTVQDYGSSPVTKNFIAGDVLFSGSPASGSYQCLGIKMSDVISFTPAADMAPCQSGTPVSNDIYPAGSTDFKDINLDQIIGHGGNGSGVDDKILLVFTTSPSAAEARGFSANQVVPLLNAVTVPTSGTMVWNTVGQVMASSFSCTLSPGQISFR